MKPTSILGKVSGNPVTENFLWGTPLSLKLFPFSATNRLLGGPTMILDLNQKKHVVNKGRSQQPLEKGGVAVNTVK